VRIFVLAGFIILSMVLQATVLHGAAVAGVKPNLLLILVLFFSLLEGSVPGFIFGFLVGLFEDLVIGKFVGLHALTMMLTGLLIGFAEPKIFKENYLTPVVVVFFGTLIHEFAFLFLGNLIGMSFDWGNLVQIVLPLTVYHSCISPFLYVPFYKLFTSNWLRKDR